MNSYLVVQDDHALLINTGLTTHQDALVLQLSGVLPQRARLSILPLRFGEFGGVCNVPELAEKFHVDHVYGDLFGEPWEWLDFRPSPRPRSGARALHGLTSRPLGAGQSIAVDPAGTRIVRTLVAPIRLLPFPWAYDEESGTLFTTEAFGWMTRQWPEGPWVTNLSDSVDASLIYEMLVLSRFWWLPGAKLSGMRADLDRLFSTYAVNTIAPAFGAILRGGEVVARHVAFLDEALARAETSPATGVAAGSWRLEGRR